MKRIPSVLLATAVVAAAGFAAASILSGAGIAAVLTGTTATDVGTTTTASTPTTVATPSGRRIVVCHLTRSRKHPAVTIAVSRKALKAILKGGGHLGPCTGTETPRTSGFPKDTTTTAGTTTTADDGAADGTATSGRGDDRGGDDHGGDGHGVRGHGHGR